MFNAAHAQMGGGPPPEEKIPEVDKETWIYKFPDKWYPFSRTSDAKLDTYIFPAGQNPQKWKEGLHFEEFLTTVGVKQASDVFELQTKGTHTPCVDYTAELVRDQPENNYSMNQWSVRCNYADKSTLVTLNKAILGNDKLYIAKKMWKYEPKETEMKRWSEYFDQVYVCDPRTGVNSCKPPNRPTRGPGQR
jgi:hypothetical protein